MERIIISLEATCDLPRELREKYDFRQLNMHFCVDGKEYCTDKDTVVSSGIYEKMQADARTSTSQISAANYEGHFERLMQEGVSVLHIALSSGVSGTYMQAVAAAKKVDPSGQKITVIDSMCGGSAQGLLAILVAEYMAGARDKNAVIEFVNEIKMRVEHAFTLDNLKYLARGGRLGGLAAFAGNMLKIKPVMKVDEKGRLALDKKVLTRQRALRTLFADYRDLRDVSCPWCFISHANCYEDALSLSQMIANQTGVQPVINDLGPVLGSHGGPGTIAIFYLSINSRKKPETLLSAARYRLATGVNV